MKPVSLAIALVCAEMIAASPAAGANGMTPLPDVGPAIAPLIAQARRCGPRPMQPSSCLNGTWVCRCRTGGEICAWELIGCGSPGSLEPRPDAKRPQPSSPGEPVRPDVHGR